MNEEYSILSKALADVIIPEINREYEDMNQPHEFSRKFERKMSKLIRRQRKFYYPLIRTPLRFAVTIVVIVSLMAGLTVAACEPLRKWVTQLFVTENNTSAVICFTTEDINDAELIRFAKPTYIPDGFEVVDTMTSDTTYRIKLSNGTESIYFTQIIINAKSSVNTEDTTTEIIKINGHDAFYTHDEDSSCLTWSDGEYTFEILAYSTDIDICTIAESVGYVEN